MNVSVKKKHTDCLKDRVVKRHSLAEIGTQSGHTNHSCWSNDAVGYLRLGVWAGSSTTFLIKIDADALLGDWKATP